MYFCPQVTDFLLIDCWRLNHNFKSRSWLAYIPILTKGMHKNSRINEINKNKILKYLRAGGIPIITGFPENSYERVTTIGRGGSDNCNNVIKFF